ncbi:hypothetical protein GOBAR_AA26250 [Gossypium barbadense]|uniref:Uncharacterized protein n=1 Tax=Gossypium barbadense TaxID=3634 RepID=A0A2P5WTN0_GOSBA|nr:hypothetical protein GOBAR_AA26250 [Gossypium barbadense]
MMITTSPSASSQTETRDSSHVLALGNSLLPSVSPVSVPPPIELPLWNISELAPSHKNLNHEELQDIMGNWLNSSFQAFLAEASMIRLGIEKRIGRIEATQKELEVNLKVTTLHVELKKVTKEHKVDISRINTDYENAMATGCCSSATNLDMTAESFSFTNYVGGCDSSPTSLRIIVESFALANYVGGCDSLPMSLSVKAGNFALTNCVRGWGSFLVSLNVT